MDCLASTHEALDLTPTLGPQHVESELLGAKGRKVTSSRSSLPTRQVGSQCGLLKTLSQKREGGEDDEAARQVKPHVAQPDDLGLIPTSNI